MRYRNDGHRLLLLGSVLWFPASPLNHPDQWNADLVIGLEHDQLHCPCRNAFIYEYNKAMDILLYGTCTVQLTCSLNQVPSLDDCDWWTIGSYLGLGKRVNRGR